MVMASVVLLLNPRNTETPTPGGSSRGNDDLSPTPMRQEFFTTGTQKSQRQRNDGGLMENTAK